MNRSNNDTITAIATGVGGAISVIRLSGKDAITICDSVFKSASGQSLAKANGYTLHYGEIVDNQRIIDDVIVSVFRSPKSYTSEDMVEVSCHASSYIQNEIIKLFINAGARAAEPGEFTIRAFLAGKLDLSQAEAVADMIASTDRATHALASNQMRGGYSAEFATLRKELIDLVSLLELELDFSEEDVEFADRNKLIELITTIEEKVNSLLNSFSLGNVIKDGIGVAIIGAPNVGKSTLLNAILKDDRAMVSDIAGTTRDVIEESVNIDGIKFRFIDTAGIRTTEDALEKMGIERTFGSIEKANIILYLIEATDDLEDSLNKVAEAINNIELRDDQTLALIINKADHLESANNIYRDTNWLEQTLNNALGDGSTRPFINIIALSAKKGDNIEQLLQYLSNHVDTEAIYTGQTIVSNSRHYEALLRSSHSLSRAHSGLTDGIPTDLLSQDIRETLHHLGTITGEITTDEILTNIFTNFCIGK